MKKDQSLVLVLALSLIENDDLPFDRLLLAYIDLLLRLLLIQICVDVYFVKDFVRVISAGLGGSAGFQSGLFLLLQSEGEPNEASLVQIGVNSG